MDIENKLPITELMEILAGEAGISLPLLYQFSDLSPEELAIFREAWPKLHTKKRKIIVRHLADISEENFVVDFSDVFAICLLDEDAEVRKASLDGLWDCDRVGLISPIIRIMQDDPDEQVRTIAAATLGHYVLMGEWNQIPRKPIEVVVNALLALLDNSETAFPVRRAALESLGAASHPRVYSIVKEAYDSADRELQISAVFAMGRSADRSWVPIIIGEMSSPITEMRLEAARAAGAIGSTDAVAKLARLIWDDDLEVRLAAVNALGQIGGSAAQRILEQLTSDPEADELHEAVYEALDEMEWLGSEIDLSLFDWDDNMDDI